MSPSEINFNIINVKTSPHERMRPHDKSHAEILLRVKHYFEGEQAKKKGMNLYQIAERTAAATGVSRKIVSLIKTEEYFRKSGIYAE